MSPDDEEKLYQATRRASVWVGMVLECDAIAEMCRRDLTAWLAAIPADWWPRFDVDDKNESGALPT